MPLDFRVKIEMSAGPFQVSGSNEYSCRESMLSMPSMLVYEKWEIAAIEKHPNIMNDMHWFFGLSRSGDCWKVPFLLYEDRITEVTCTLSVKSHFVMEFIKILSKSVADRYPDVDHDIVWTTDGFTNHRYPNVVFYSTSINAVGALWWMVLADRLTFLTDSACRSLADLIYYSDQCDDNAWYGYSDKDAHLELWNNPNNEIPVSDWILSGSGPCIGKEWAENIRKSAAYKVDYIRLNYPLEG